MPKRSRLFAVSTLLAMVALPVLAGCGGSSSAPAKAPAKAPAAKSAPAASSSAAPKPAAKPTMTNISLQLPWLSSGPDAPFYYGVSKGYFKAAGLNVSISPGKSSLLTSETVASGKATFGYADSTAVAGVVGNGGKIKVIAQIIDSSPVGIIHRPNLSLKTAKDLEGQTILTNSAGGPVIAMLHAVLAASHVPVSAVHLDIVSPAAEASSFAAHPKDLLTGFCNSTYPAAHKLVPSSVCTPDQKLASAGQVYSYAIITTDHEIQAHPNTVRKFVAASVRSWKAAIQNRTSMVAPSLKTAQQLKQRPPGMGIWKLGWEQTLAGMNQPQGKPFGTSQTAAWSSMLKLLHQYAGLHKVLAPSDYFTNAFLPKA